MVTAYECKVYNSMEKLEDIREVWNKLALQMQEGESCHSYEWFECWYYAFCDRGNERIVLLYERDRLRAIFPGMLVEKKVRGIPFTTFSYAGNGHSPRCGVLAERGDVAAILAVISSINARIIGCSFDFMVFMGVMSGTNTYVAIHKMSENQKIYIENRYASPTCSLSEGWEKYLETRPSSLVSHHRKYFNKAVKIAGEPVFELIDSENYDCKAYERLRQIDMKTWQHKNGTGLFSNLANEKFYRSIFDRLMPIKRLSVSFLSVGNKDIAYFLCLMNERVVFSIKTGFDADFGKCSPGVLLMYNTFKHYSNNGFQEFDLLGERSELKMNWATHCQEHSNIWIFGRRSVKSYLLSIALNIKLLLKAAKVIFVAKNYNNNGAS